MGGGLGVLGGSGMDQVEAANGQLSDDGRSFWWNGRWYSSISPDGESSWNGTEWQPVSADYFPSYPKSPGPALDIDDRSFGEGTQPPKAKDLPSTPTFGNGHIAIGQGWVAHHETISGWEVIQIRDVQSIAIVPPSRTREAAFMRVPTLPRPFVAIKDRFGQAFSVAVTKCPVEVGRALEAQLPADTNVTPAAAAFLQSGGLPGEWGKGFTLGKSWD